MRSGELIQKYETYKNSQFKYPVNITIKPDNPRAFADKYVLDHYGDCCSLGDELAKKNQVIFPILADMPVRIDEEEKMMYKWINVGQIGEIKIKESKNINKNIIFKIDSAPNFRGVLKSIRDKYFLFRDNLESELVKASGFRFAKIDEIKDFMKPASLLIKRFAEDIKHEIPRGVHYKDILVYDERERWIKYMIKSDLVSSPQKTNEGLKVFPTDIMQSYIDKSLGSDEYSFEESCLGKIILHNQDDISKFNPMFKSYLKLTNSLYQASFERGKILEVTSKTWIDGLYTRRYRKPNNRLRERFRLIYADDLKESGLVSLESDDIYSPKKDIFNHYSEGAKQNILEKFPFSLEFWDGETVG